MFKRRNPDKPRPGGDLAAKALEKLKQAEADNQEATESFDAGRAAEEAGDDEAAMAAYRTCIQAWARRHEDTGHGVPYEPFERLAILLRRAKEPRAEAAVLERYHRMNRDPHPKLTRRLERARELVMEAEMAEMAETSPEEDSD